MNDDKAAIQEQILDAAEAVSHLTIRAEQDAERDEQYNIACEGDDYFDYMMDKRFDRQDGNCPTPYDTLCLRL